MFDNARYLDMWSDSVKMDYKRSYTEEFLYNLIVGAVITNLFTPVRKFSTMDIPRIFRHHRKCSPHP